MDLIGLFTMAIPFLFAGGCMLWMVLLVTYRSLNKVLKKRNVPHKKWHKEIEDEMNRHYRNRKIEP